MSSEHVGEVVVLPDGLDIDSSDVRAFGVRVIRRPGDTFSVEAMGGQYACDGSWTDSPVGAKRDHYRFPYEEAMSLARQVVDDVLVLGRTWAQWQDDYHQLGVHLAH